MTTSILWPWAANVNCKVDVRGGEQRGDWKENESYDRTQYSRSNKTGVNSGSSVSTVDSELENESEPTLFHFPEIFVII